MQGSSAAEDLLTRHAHCREIYVVVLRKSIGEGCTFRHDPQEELCRPSVRVIPLPFREHTRKVPPSSHHREAGSVTKQHHCQHRCLVTHPIGPKSANARSGVNKLLFRVMTSPPPAIVDNVDNHAAAIARLMRFSRSSPGACLVFIRKEEMATLLKAPSDEGVIRTTSNTLPHNPQVGWYVLLGAILGSSMAFLDSSVVNLALPLLQVDLHATTADVQWVMEIYMLFLAAFILVGGILGDHYGRRRIFVIGIVIFTLASVSCGFAPNLALLLLARAIQGLGGHYWCQEAWRSSVARSVTRSANKPLASGQPGSRSLPSWVRLPVAGWYNMLPGAGPFFSMSPWR